MMSVGDGVSREEDANMSDDVCWCRVDRGEMELGVITSIIYTRS